jgi:hypothetical protein
VSDLVISNERHTRVDTVTARADIAGAEPMRHGYAFGAMVRYVGQVFVPDRIYVTWTRDNLAEGWALSDVKVSGHRLKTDGTLGDQRREWVARRRELPESTPDWVRDFVANSNPALRA